MIRKTLLALPFLGLVLSFGLWGFCYTNTIYSGWEHEIRFKYGTAYWQAVFVDSEPESIAFSPQWKIEGFDGWYTTWMPTYRPNFTGPRSFFVTMPMWIPTLICQTTCGLVVFQHSRSEQRHKHGRCEQCGYDLTGNESGVCPECGFEIDQA